jgi:phosphoglycolate phosphatase-like HAD superfamily hydrolase
MQRLVLWDLDGTLLSAGRVASAAFHDALQAVVGPEVALEPISYAGKTDLQIVRESFPTLDHDQLTVLFPAIQRAYLERLHAQRATLAARATIFPGVLEALHALRPRAYQAPLTGNMRAAAQIKLACTGLSDWLDLAAGAYGDDHAMRSALVPLAAARAAERYRQAFPAAQIVVIGDTPHDIACGKANGTRTVAVATGTFTLAQLAAHSPDVLLPDLCATDALLAAVLG